MARRKDHPNNAYNKSTRFAQYERAKKARASVLKLRGQIPWVLGPNTYIYATIAANGGVLRQTDILVSFGGSANRINEYDAKFARMLRTFKLQTRQGRGPRGLAIMFDERFPLYKEVYALARAIGELHPIPVENKMPDEMPPPPSSPASRNIDLLAGSEVNTLVLATVRALRGKVGLQQLTASVPYDSMTAVERGIQRLRDYRILEGGEGQAIRFATAPWTRHLERLYDGYLRLRPELREQIRERHQVKKERVSERSDVGLFGYKQTERILTTLAVHGPMPRTELAAKTMMTHRNQVLRPLVEAGILAVQERRGERAQQWVSLNGALPVYKELRALLLALAGERAKTAAPFAEPRDSYDPIGLFDSAPLFWALLMMNAVKERELDVASLNRLRSKHAPFTLHGRMRWLMDQGYVARRQQGLVLYYRLNPDFDAHTPLKRLLDAISRAWPELVEAAQFNDDLKPAIRLTKDQNARKRLTRGS